MIYQYLYVVVVCDKVKRHAERQTSTPVPTKVIKDVFEFEY